MQRLLAVGLMALGALGIASPTYALTLEEAQALLASDGEPGDYLGHSVSVSGDTAVIGAYGDENHTGAAYVFIRNGEGNWTEKSKLKASDGTPGDNFGESVAVANDTVIIGAPQRDDSGSESGAAYVFARDGDGNWKEQAKLLASDGAAYAFFGGAVAVADGTALIGASEANHQGPSSGAAYVFTGDDAGWTEVDKLVPDDGSAGDYFGQSIAVSGDTAVIGAYQADANGPSSGAAYVFAREGDGWAEQVKLVSSDGGPGDYFGYSVAVSEDTVIVGAARDGNNSSGAAYVFIRDGSNWTNGPKLLASDGKVGDHFGNAAAVSGDMVVIGANGNDATGPRSGAAYIFARDAGGGWSEMAKVPTKNEVIAGSELGTAVTLTGDTAVIGAPLADNANGSDAGAAYAISPNQVASASSQREPKFKDPNPDEWRGFTPVNRY